MTDETEVKILEAALNCLVKKDMVVLPLEL
jgi:hypothetical protein